MIGSAISISSALQIGMFTPPSYWAWTKNLRCEAASGDAVGVLGFVEVESEEQVDEVLAGQNLKEELGPVIANRVSLCDFDDVAVNFKDHRTKLLKERAGHLCHLDLTDIPTLGTLPHGTTRRIEGRGTRG